MSGHIKITKSWLLYKFMNTLPLHFKDRKGTIWPEEHHNYYSCLKGSFGVTVEMGGAKQSNEMGIPWRCLIIEIPSREREKGKVIKKKQKGKINCLIWKEIKNNRQMCGCMRGKGESVHC